MSKLIRSLALVSVLATASGVAYSSTASAQVYVVTRTPHSAPRLRFGVSGVVGGFAGRVGGGLGGIEPRIGVQFNDLFGLYFQGQWLFGGIFPRGFDGRWAGFSFNQVMADFTLFDMLQLGAGPSFDYIWGCDANEPACADSGPYFGVNGRIAMIVGGGSWNRHGVTVSLDIHPTVLRGDATTAFLFGIGGELY
jgi:hypothetical protein